MSILNIWVESEHLLHHCYALVDFKLRGLSSAVSVWIAGLTQPRLQKVTSLKWVPYVCIGHGADPHLNGGRPGISVTRLRPKLSLRLKQAPDGHGVRLWKNQVDRIQDPVKGLSLTRRILASGGLWRLYPIPAFRLLLRSLLLSSVSLRTGAGKFQHLLFIYQLITIPPRASVPLRVFTWKWRKQTLSVASFVPRFSGIVRQDYHHGYTVHQTFCCKWGRDLYFAGGFPPHLDFWCNWRQKWPLPSALAQYRIHLKATLGGMQKHGTMTQPWLKLGKIIWWRNAAVPEHKSKDLSGSLTLKPEVSAFQVWLPDDQSQLELTRLNAFWLKRKIYFHVLQIWAFQVKPN